MKKYKTPSGAKTEAICAANIYGGMWVVIKYPHDYGVVKLQSDIRIDPTLEVIYKAGSISIRTT